MRKPLTATLILAASLVLAAMPAQARKHNRYMRASAAAAPVTPAPVPPPTSADDARTGWIYGASPFNPEGSSNPVFTSY